MQTCLGRCFSRIDWGGGLRWDRAYEDKRKGPNANLSFFLALFCGFQQDSAVFCKNPRFPHACVF